MEYIYIVFYSREHPYNHDDYITDCISKIFKTEEKAIKYCESLGKKMRNIIGMNLIKKNMTGWMSQWNTDIGMLLDNIL